jgi:hypothetical protein
MRSARIPANGRPKVGRDETRVDPVPSERPVGAEATAIRGQKLVPVSLLLTFMDQVGQLPNIAVPALVAFAQQSPRSQHYRRRRKENGYRNRQVVQR